jgi:hypothetical protein
MGEEGKPDGAGRFDSGPGFLDRNHCPAAAEVAKKGSESRQHEAQEDGHE